MDDRMHLGDLGSFITPAFKRHVRRELDDARHRCFDVLGIPYERRPRSDRGGRHRYTKGVCAGCRCPWDRMTPGCPNCVGRDHARQATGRPRLTLI